jgi:NOL1/NOP2/sun family putative RNA methylase
VKLPEIFSEKMLALLGENEFEDFLKSYNCDRYYGLRVNTLKIGVEDFLKISPFELTKIPWTIDGFYYKSEDSPGKHPFYYMGLYYIQEPSAMFPATILDAKQGEKVLDMCAAPGGKTIQISASMKNEGLLVSNDISGSRIKALIKNVELMGLKNCVVTNETPHNLAQKFVGYFDRILVDAPCSGEGMFRKDPEAVKSYDKYKPDRCVVMQKDILHNADLMLREGGYIVYSTCTFNPNENEGMIEYFSKKYNYKILKISKVQSVSDGNPHWSNNFEDLVNTARIWPHKANGEGHYVALLQKQNKSFEIVSKENDINIKISNQELLFREFEKSNLKTVLKGNIFAIGNNLYYLPKFVPELSGLKISKFGLFLGQVNDKRHEFEPSHSFLLCLKKEEILNTITFDIHSSYLKKYLKGETVIFEEDSQVIKNVSNKKELVAVCVNDFPLGYAKLNDGMLKNLYPKGWRML